MGEKARKFDIELFFRALADRTRLRLISLMGDDEICVCYFVAGLMTSQPKISRHLAYMRKAGIVTARREGKWMHYRVSDPPDSHAARIFREVREWLAQDEDMKRDRARLLKACCGPRIPVQLRSAPRPASLAQPLGCEDAPVVPVT